MSFNPIEHQHTRYNPLKDEWILVSPHRMQRPWDGQVEKDNSPEIPEFDENNPLCPGVTRPNGMVTPEYESTYVFENDFPAMSEHAPEVPKTGDPLFQYGSALGTCRVMCFHPKTNVTLPTMTIEEILNVINTWVDQMVELGERYPWVQIFENKGSVMGCSNPHPHCQIWASSFIPNEPRIKDANQLKYFKRYGRPLLMDYVQRELENKERIVVENNNWVAVVPFWAVWPFETMLLPKQHIKRFYDLNMDQRLSLSEIVKDLTTKYDNLFKTSFPYSMGWHGAPTGNYSSHAMEHWVFHGIYLPPLLRSASIKKFMVGYEMLGQCQRDLSAEKAAETLRNLPTVHYKQCGALKQSGTSKP